MKAVQEELQKYVPVVEAVGEEGKLSAAELKSIIVDSNKKYSTKETLTDFNFRVKKFSSQCFTDAGKLLQKMKDIKKAYANQKLQKEGTESQLKKSQKEGTESQLKKEVQQKKEQPQQE